MRIALRVAAAIASMSLVVGLFAAAPVASAASFTIGMSVSDRTIQVTDSAVLNGTSTLLEAGRTVEIQRRYRGSSTWSTVAKTATTATGTFTAAIRMTNDRDRYFRARIVDGANRSYSSSTPRVYVSPATFKLAIKVDPTLLDVGSRVSITGTLAPYYSGSHSVRIQYRYVGSKRWHTLRYVSAGTDGKFATTTSTSSTKDRYYRATKSASGSRRGATTASVKVVVLSKASVTVETIPFQSEATTDAGRNECQGPQVTTAGRNGRITRTYRDGKLISTVTVQPTTQVMTYPGSDAVCLTETMAQSGSDSRPQALTFTGHNLDRVTSVKVGDVTATNLSVMAARWGNPGHLYADIAAQPAGTYPVVLTTASGTINAGTFTFTGNATSVPTSDPTPSQTPVPTSDPTPSEPTAPVNLTVSPTSGTLTGGGLMTITGTGLADVTKVTFTSQSAFEQGYEVLPIAATIKSSSATQVQVTIPGGLAGVSIVELTTPNGTATGRYTYVATNRAPTAFEQDVLTRINANRAIGFTCGGTWRPAAAPLTWNGKLTDVAGAHAADLDLRWAQYGGIGHATLTNGANSLMSNGRVWMAGFSFETSSLEVIADMGATRTAAQTVDGWFASAGHCGILMKGDRTTIGLARNDNSNPLRAAGYTVIGDLI